jgi:uncharacterized protein
MMRARVEFLFRKFWTRIRLLVLLPLALGSASDTWAQEGRSFLWEVTSPRGTGFLLGSLHLARPEIYPLSERILKHYAESGTLAVEADVTSMGPAMQELLAASAHYSEGDGLSRRLRPETLNRLHDAGVDIAVVDRVRPWYLAMSLQLGTLGELGFEQRYGVDLHFLNRAKQEGKRIVELEGIELQMEMLIGLAEMDEDLFIDYTLEDLSTTREEAERLFQAWLSGDDGYVDRLITRTFLRNPAFEPLYDKLFLQRNRQMAERVLEMIDRGERPFVIVGAGHLVGKGSIPELLSEMGLIVQRK